MSNSGCNCNDAPKLIFACSGAADVGELADKAARKLHREGAGKFYCLAGIGAGLNAFIENTRAAGSVLAIDGCAVDCAKKLLEKNGIANFEHIRITDLGIEKGKADINDESIEMAASQGRTLLKGAYA